MANFIKLQEPTLDKVMENYYRLIAVRNAKNSTEPFVFEVDGEMYYVSWHIMKWNDPVKTTDFENVEKLN